MTRIWTALTAALFTVPLAAEGPAHWAYRPVSKPTPPETADPSRAATPIDRFLQATAEADGVPLAAPADRHTLIRRVTFDLTGLPPSPDDVDRFAADGSPDALEKWTDRLLASPAYGERWGRHWLDVSRYADSNGLDENVAYGNAWRYRDYVIGSFNADTPFDRFVTEQLAGDLLPAPDEATRHRNRIATGFLSLGPKVLAEVDEAKMEMDIIDEQLDTVGRALMGLTLGCARCHDHKFDPVGTDDYYALAGVFKSTRTMEHFRKIARWHESPIPGPDDLARKAAHEARAVELRAELDRAREEGATEEERMLREKALKDHETAAPELPTAMGVAEGEVSDVAIHIRGDHLELGEVVPRRVPRFLADGDAPTFPKDASGRLELAEWLTRPAHPLTGRVIVNRVWRWHFGRGLVASPDNFGKLGSRPTHPELLDWLAADFADNGWSMKRLHRMILLSAAYQRSSKPASESADPEGRYYSRWHLRRLTAEEIRDGLLAVSGTLDRSMGGSMLHVGNREFFFDHTSKDTTNYGSPRRSVYLPVVRNNLYDVFGLFDCTDAAVPNGDRSTTTVAPQALFFLNGGPVLDAAEALAAALDREPDLDDEGRVREIYRRAFGREPTPAESLRSLQLVGEAAVGLGEDRPGVAAWACLCQVVLASNEFAYVR